MKKRIVVVEPMSTAFHFLEDIRERGYEPVILEAYLPEGYARDMMDQERKAKYSRIKYPIKLLYESPDYEKTLEEIRSLDPLLVIPGGEEGVILGTRLADDLGLLGNRTSDIPKMTQKSVMHQCLKSAGLRYIHGRIVKSEEECLEFLEEIGTENVVLKHVHGVASVGVHICSSRDEVLAAFRQELQSESMFGDSEVPLMIQERIFGDEYVVNTISRDGVPALTSVFRYHKKVTPAGYIVYNGMETVDEHDPVFQNLVDYAFSVVPALGIENGPVHGEYMLDSKGPVLIEANCRVMGGSMPTDYLDQIFEYHETGVALDCMLDADYHRSFCRRDYHPIRKGYAKDFISKEERPIHFSGIIPILMHLKSYHSGWVVNAGLTDLLQETIDLETEIGCVYLLSDDPDTVKRDYELLCYIEDNYPELFHSDHPLFQAPDNPSEITPEIEQVLKEDTETLIADIISYYRKIKDPGNGNLPSPVPETLIEAKPYNREIIELLKRLA